MNAKERKALVNLLRTIRGPSARAATFDLEHGYQSFHEEAARLMKSPDYRLGFERCAENVRSVLASLGVKPEEP